jgi:hypothetical protein
MSVMAGTEAHPASARDGSKEWGGRLCSLEGAG